MLWQIINLACVIEHSNDSPRHGTGVDGIDRQAVNKGIRPITWISQTQNSQPSWTNFLCPVRNLLKKKQRKAAVEMSAITPVAKAKVANVWHEIGTFVAHLQTDDLL